MKSLIESLFDSKTQITESLFDKDIVSKDLKIGDLYELDRFYFGGDNDGYYAFDIFSVKKLKLDFKKSNLQDVIKYWKPKSFYGVDDSDDRRNRNRPFIINVLFHIINNYSINYSYNKQSLYTYYGKDDVINNLLSNLSQYLLTTLLKYTDKATAPYISGGWDERHEELFIRIGKYQTRGFNQYIKFIFKKK